jgi:hypothetical protein
MLEILASDGHNNCIIDDTDKQALLNYVTKESFTPNITFPQPLQTAVTNIGTSFDVIKLTLEKFIDRKDDYTSNPSSRNSVTHTIQDVFSDTTLANRNLLTSPAQININKQFGWSEHLVVAQSNPRTVPCVFTDGYTDKILPQSNHYEYNSTSSFDPGKVDLYAPSNIIIGDGQLIKPNGEYYKVDFEIGQITFEVPANDHNNDHNQEQTVNLLTDFIAEDISHPGKTRLGYPAMKYADGSTVKADALVKDNVRLSVSVQSFSPNINGGNNSIFGAVIDGKIGVDLDYTTGILKLNFSNLYEDVVLKTLNTKIQLVVFIKKAGFNNKPIYVSSHILQNILNVNSVINLQNSDITSLIHLENNVTGINQVNHGGTGLNYVGPAGTILMSDGAQLVYRSLDGSLAGNSFTNITSNTHLTASDSVILIDSTASPVTVYLYGTPTSGRQIIIKDAAGFANTNNITINGNGKSIDGVSSIVMQINYSSTTLLYNGTKWLEL